MRARGWGAMLHAVYSAWCTERGLTTAFRAVDFMAGFAVDGASTEHHL